MKIFHKMWKLLLLILYTNHCCLAGPVVLKKNMPIIQQKGVIPIEENNPTFTTANQRQPKESAFSSGMTIMSTLNLPSNASSIRSNIMDGFSCQNKTYGYYADIENDCQLFHICLPVTYASGKESIFRWSFICPEETVFSQDSFICMRPEDMTIACEDSYKYYELNRNFGIIDNAVDVNKENDNSVISQMVPETMGHAVETESIPEYSITVPEEKPNRPSMKQPLHKPNRPKPNSSFIIQNRPKFSHPLRKIPPIQTDEITETVQIDEQAEEEHNKPVNNRYTKRPMPTKLSIVKDKIFNIKAEDKYATKSHIYNQKRKQPVFFNKKTATANLQPIDENDSTKTDKVEQNFFKLESDMSNENINTEVADVDSQSSENKVMYVKPQETTETDSFLSVTLNEENPSEPINKDYIQTTEEMLSVTEEKENKDNKVLAQTSNNENTNDASEVNDGIEESLITENTLASTSDEVSTNTQINSLDKLANEGKTQISEINQLQSNTNPNNDNTQTLMEDVPLTEDNNQILINELQENNQNLNIEDDAAVNHVMDKEKEIEKTEDDSSQIDIEAEESSAEVATSNNVQTIEEMEAEKPAEAPESMPATDELLEQSSPAVQEMFEVVKTPDTLNAAEAEKLLVDFIKQMRDTEEQHIVSMAKDEDSEDVVIPQKELEMISIKDDGNVESTEEMLEHKNENNNEMNLKNLYNDVTMNTDIIHEPQIIEEDIENLETTNQETPFFSTNNDDMAVTADNTYPIINGYKSLSFDDVVDMVKERLEHMPKNEMKNRTELDATVNTEELPEENNSETIRTQSEEYIVPIYHRTINNEQTLPSIQNSNQEMNNDSLEVSIS